MLMQITHSQLFIQNYDKPGNFLAQVLNDSSTTGK
jgi:hypothetical protein